MTAVEWYLATRRAQPVLPEQLSMVSAAQFNVLRAEWKRGYCFHDARRQVAVNDQNLLVVSVLDESLSLS